MSAEFLSALQLARARNLPYAQRNFPRALPEGQALEICIRCNPLRAECLRRVQALW